MPAEIRRIAAFLDIANDESRWEAIVEHCSFDYMKAHAAASVPLGGAFWDGGAQTFVHKGTNGRWRDKIGRASGRERVCQYVEISVVAVTLKKKNIKNQKQAKY